MANPAQDREKLVKEFHKSGMARRPARSGFSFIPSRESVIALSFVICFFLSTIYLKRYFTINELKREEGNLQVVLDDLKQQNERLHKQVGELKTLTGVERIARERLGMVKSGEVVIRSTSGSKGSVASEK